MKQSQNHYQSHQSQDQHHQSHQSQDQHHQSHQSQDQHQHRQQDQSQPSQAQSPSSQRLLSLDALRGFDMFFIMGGAWLVASLATLWPCPFFDALAEQMDHVEWDGLKHHDTIFPLFLFIAGISFPFSLAKQRRSGKSESAILGKIFRRGLMLVFLGAVYNGLLQFDFAHFRWASVLARIGLAWMLAAWLFVKCRTAVRVAIAVGVLVGYSLWMVYVPVPGQEGLSPLSLAGNWVGYVDRMLLPGQLYDGVFDPEGLLSTLPAVVTAMLGMFAGEWVQMERRGWTDRRKVVGMGMAALVLLGVGLLWNEVFPINKKLWSSSFVCVVGAYSLGMFALFYYLVDVLGWRRWTFFFQVIGVNSLTIYLAQSFVNFSFTSRALLGGVIQAVPESAQPLLSALAYVAVAWSFLYFLYRQRIFLKV